jgi:hypothetical protein
MATFSNPVLSLSVEMACDATSFTIKEATGAYHATTNPNGWGGPGGANILDVDSTSVVVTTPGGVEYTFNTSAVFPDSTETNTYVINETDLGMSDKLTDGVYLFKYAVVENADPEFLDPEYKYVLVDYTIKGLVYSRIAAINYADCNCDITADVLDTMEIYSAFKAMQNAGCLGKVAKVNELLAYLQTRLNNEICSSC